MAFLVVFAWVQLMLRLKAQSEAESTCFEGVKFVLIPVRVEFSEAKDICEASGMSLARISKNSEFNAVRDFRRSLNFNDKFWIGKWAVSPRVLVNLFVGVEADRDLPTPGGDRSQRFVFSDGSSEGLDFIRAGVGNKPWDDGEPDGAPVFSDAQDCVE